VPELADQPEAVRRQRLERLAELATAVSASVSFHPCALVFEIRSSLRYFGGIDSLHGKLAPAVSGQLQGWGLSGGFRHAASPTVSGSLLLARAGDSQLVYRRDNLRSALGRLSTDVLELDREQRRRLYNMGVRRLRDIWRLPADGLRKRFGSSFVNQLRQALGERPEPQLYYQPPPAFDCS
jgi:protein ImuB